ncbi:hypothetical protein BT96DRAFT_968085 [Gymnopus androsaceus JB14]|uniref:Polymerase beta nucleotidyltransferase domain-containing protein n=1 Tax=Gymnopus androsaceus JB14 TaxID=1447944 RepID=A0A6A4GSQ8_9AGAR|nr:hypothetical protein BT96DRAFT_968085 [Gymnopus androsaceus JB14]
MSIPTFDEMYTRLLPVWEREENREMVSWAGIFGSVGRGRAHKDSDVDIVLVMKEGASGEPIELEQDLKAACGRDVSYLVISRNPEDGSWMWGHVPDEALLSARTVFGDPKDIAHLKQEGFSKLFQAKKRYESIAEVVQKIKCCVARAQTLETFLLPDFQATRQQCLSALYALFELLDIPFSDPIRTIPAYTAFEKAEQTKKIIRDGSLDIDATVWAKIWPRLQAGDLAMWSWDVAISCAQTYLKHMFASARLADSFERGLSIDDSLYVDIAR